MSKFTLVRTRQPMPVIAVVWDAIRSFLFDCMDGIGDADKKQWRRFWKRVRDMEAGELIEVEMAFPRNSRFHRKLFALLQLGFDAWDIPRKRKMWKGMMVEKNFDQFREDITIAAGFYTQTFDMNGRLILRAKSISFAKMDDAQFEEVYSAVADVLLAGVLVRYKGRDELDGVIEKIIGFL